MSILEQLLAEFPVRKTKAQKKAFREWFVSKARDRGYTAHVEASGPLGWSNNVVIGDPEKAEVIFTAHYDTPATLPIPNFITPRNMLVYLLYQMGIVLLMLIPVFGAGLIAGSIGLSAQTAYWIGMILLWTMLILMLVGPANPNNANDNTSGVAAVMELMAALPEEKRAKAAFILFDDEEKGMMGSSAYAKEHKQVKKDKLLINMDCVGVGETILFFAPKKARALPAYEALQASMASQSSRLTEFFPLEKSMYPSDQAQFKHGIAVCACKKQKWIGYYCSRIHTKGDTLCEQGCLDALRDGLTRFVETL